MFWPKSYICLLIRLHGVKIWQRPNLKGQSRLPSALISNGTHKAHSSRGKKITLSLNYEKKSRFVGEGKQWSSVSFYLFFFKGNEDRKKRKILNQRYVTTILTVSVRVQCSSTYWLAVDSCSEYCVSWSSSVFKKNQFEEAHLSLSNNKLGHSPRINNQSYFCLKHKPSKSLWLFSQRPPPSKRSICVQLGQSFDQDYLSLSCQQLGHISAFE